MYQREKKVNVEKIDEDSVVVQRKDKTIVLNSTAFFIYENIEKFNNIQELVDSFINQYSIADIESNQIIEDFNVVIGNLKNEGLLI